MGQGEPTRRVDQTTRLDPTNRLLAIIDDASAAPMVRRALVHAGIPEQRVELVSGPTGVARLDPLGASGGWWLRLKRLVGFMQADQSVDLALYQAALDDGRLLIALLVSAEQRPVAVEVLRGQGAHFVNFYGTLVTEEIIPWRGERPPLPGFLQR